MQKPIGYWLKHLDALIEERFERTLAEEGVSRREWQTLNALPDPATALAPFGGHALDALEARGWVHDNTLTAAGETAFNRLQQKVHAMRAEIADGIEPEAYRTTVATLERMAANLAAH